MKILISVLLASTLSGCYYVSSEPGGYNTPSYDPDAVMKINAQGMDLRVYEFTPQTSPSVQCVFVAGERKGGLVCFKKESK